MTARTGEIRPLEPPHAARQSLQGHYAGFASRFAAFVVDLVVLTGIFILGLAAINFTASALAGKGIHFNRGDTWVVVAYAVWAFIYFAHFWALNGKTAGGALFGVQVVTNDGGDVSGRRAIGRALAFPLSFLILGLGFLGILLGERRRALHDVIAGTVVIYSWDARAARLRFLSRPRYSAPPAPPESRGLPESFGPSGPAS
ncbi:MAG: RDD family protein [Streptosporangiaceae bacterium]